MAHWASASIGLITNGIPNNCSNSWKDTYNANKSVKYVLLIMVYYLTIIPIKNVMSGPSAKIEHSDWFLKQTPVFCNKQDGPSPFATKVLP